MRFNSLQIGTSYDDAHYIILAESLASGEGYQLINFPRPQLERAFPPGFPLLLAPLTFLFPNNYSILKLFSLVLWLASIYLIYRIFSKRLASPHLEILITLVALNPLLIGTSVTVMSESAYLFFSLLALYLFDKWENKKQVWLIVLVSTLIFYTQLIRTIGIALFIAFILYLLFTRRFRETAIPIVIFVTGTIIQRLITGSLISTGYQSQVFNSSISEKIGQMWSNTLGYFNETLAGSLIPIFGARLTSFLSNYNLQFLPIILNIIILFIIIFGFIISIKKKTLLDFYFIIYIFGILAFWNPSVGSVKARFLIPILPFLYFYFLNGLNFFVGKISQSNPQFSARSSITLAILLSITLLARNIQDIQNPVRNQITDLSIGASWVAENSPQDSIVMVNEPVPAYPHVQRKTINFPKQGQDLIKYLDNQRIDYIIISPLLQSPRSLDLDLFIANEVLPTLQSFPDKFIIVYENDEYNVIVYQYNGGN
ncbi:MAG: hypothetical protein JNK81_10705 [Anaerolineales bacterium]|nr:hypothetical protein [Anaerolineales bacterium]